MEKRKLIKIDDNEGLITEGGKLFKLHHYGRQHTLFFNEINGEEYDKRIQVLAEKIASFPEVNLLDVLKDCLYDMSLSWLEKLEKKLEKEVIEAKAAKREPKVKTQTAKRGTCVSLHIGGRYALTVRD